MDLRQTGTANDLRVWPETLSRPASLMMSIFIRVDFTWWHCRMSSCPPWAGSCEPKRYCLGLQSVQTASGCQGVQCCCWSVGCCFWSVLLLWRHATEMKVSKVPLNALLVHVKKKLSSGLCGQFWGSPCCLTWRLHRIPWAETLPSCPAMVFHWEAPWCFW